ncbi:MAG: hypothetical protein ABIB97_01105 [Patescibacteria group bacterium]
MAKKKAVDGTADDRRALLQFRRACRRKRQPGEPLINPVRKAEDMTKMANMARSIERSTSIDPCSHSHGRAIERRRRRERFETEAWAAIGQKPPPPPESWQRYLSQVRKKRRSDA